MYEKLVSRQLIVDEMFKVFFVFFTFNIVHPSVILFWIKHYCCMCVMCVRSAMVYGSETWAMMVEKSGRLECMEIRMVRWMCGVSLRDRVPSAELRERMGIESVSGAVK